MWPKNRSEAGSVWKKKNKMHGTCDKHLLRQAEANYFNYLMYIRISRVATFMAPIGLSTNNFEHP